MNMRLILGGADKSRLKSKVRRKITKTPSEMVLKMLISSSTLDFAYQEPYRPMKAKNRIQKTFMIIEIYSSTSRSVSEKKPICDLRRAQKKKPIVMEKKSIKNNESFSRYLGNRCTIKIGFDVTFKGKSLVSG